MLSIAGCGGRTGLMVPSGEPPQGASNVPPAPSCAAPAPVPTLLFRDPHIWAATLAIDARAVYFAQGGDTPDVVRVSKCDGTARVIPAPSSVDGPGIDLVLANGNIAWIVLDGSGGWVLTAPTTGNQARIVLDGTKQWLGEALALDGSRVYYVIGSGSSSSGHLESLPLAGGSATTLFTGWGGPVAVDGERVYAAESPPTGSALLGVPKNGGTARMLVHSVHYHDDAFATDDGYVYWLQWNDQGEDSSVMRVPKQGGPVQKIAGGQSSPDEIVVDDRYVYWTVSHGSVRSLVRAPKVGGEVQLVYAGPAIALAVDQRSLYWSSGHAIMKLDKP